MVLTFTAYVSVQNLAVCLNSSMLFRYCRATTASCSPFVVLVGGPVPYLLKLSLLLGHAAAQACREQFHTVGRQHGPRHLQAGMLCKGGRDWPGLGEPAMLALASI